MTRAQITNSFAERHMHGRYREVDRLVEAYAEAAVVEGPIFGPLRGRADIAASFQEVLTIFRGSTVRQRRAADGNRAKQMFHPHGICPQPFFGIALSWRPSRVRGVMFRRFKDDPIVPERRVNHILSRLMQLGFLKRGGWRGARPVVRAR